MESLQIAWFVLITVLLAGYAILDGYDLGAGFWHLGMDDNERGQSLRAITPFWDGNEVWLLTAGGALFAAFPPVYATVFSGFYLAMMLILFALISRAIGLEFRGKLNDAGWKKVWDFVFALGSTLAPILFGVGLGNIVRGVPLSIDKEFAGTFLGLLNPYSLLFGVTVLAIFAHHSANFLAWKTENSLYAKSVNWAKKSWYVSFVGIFLVLVWTIQMHGSSVSLTVIGALALTASFASRLLITKNDGAALLVSALQIALLFVFVAVTIFPNLVPELSGGEGLTVYNASSSAYTLKAMLILTLIGMPIVLGYTAYVYKVFWGKVK